MAIYYTTKSFGAMRAHLHMVPEGAGVYMMLLNHPDVLRDALQTAGLRLDPLRLGDRAVLYIGTTNGRMRSQVSRHLMPRSSESAFRMGLGAVLSQQLRLEVGQVDPGAGFDFAPESESLLTDWLDAHVSIAMRVADQIAEPDARGAGRACGSFGQDHAETFESKGLLVHPGPSL